MFSEGSASQSDGRKAWDAHRQIKIRRVISKRRAGAARRAARLAGLAFWKKNSLAALRRQDTQFDPAIQIVLDPTEFISFV